MEGKQNEFVHISQPLVKYEPSVREKTKKWLRPYNRDVDSVRSQTFLKQVTQPYQALLPVQAIVRN